MATAAATPCFASGAPLQAASLLGTSSPRANHHHQRHLTNQSASTAPSRRKVSLVLSSSALFGSFALPLFVPASPSKSASPEFFELPNSGGVRVLDLRIGSGEVPSIGDEVAVHYYGRLAAKQGWRFDSTYNHKDSTGDSVPFVFKLGSGNDWRWDQDPTLSGWRSHTDPNSQHTRDPDRSARSGS
ncbi:peptidyl-prolyl cis-trans isomerase FKBP17-1, chloroplastic isoform X2 [Rhodamnia argentea]|uniref:peptidylprolyl isomerase n=1 Tax=Rhodamnia argentea TaxID=178133 RepID=A0ABM3H7N1_9MYRT|nr:peptidyl-prolyl cis-trans isomerase FKBP17-1, chloroplastic isoform X2 [Rhodamnia argentea]